MKKYINISFRAYVKKRALSTFFAIFIIVAYTTKSYAISRSELQGKVEKKIEAILVSQIDSNNVEWRKKIGERSKQISTIVQYCPNETVSDNMADWIEQSILEIVKYQNNSRTLIGDDTHAERLIGHFKTNAKYTLLHLSSVSIQSLQSRSKALLASANQYRKDRNIFLISQLSKYPVLKINFGASANLGIDSFTEIVRAMNNNPESQSVEQKGTERLDFRDSNINSMLLSCAFVRKIDNAFDWDKRSDNLSYTNLLSPPLFLPEFKSVDFVSVKPKVEELFNKCVFREESGITAINYDLFLNFLRDSYVLHWDNLDDYSTKTNQSSTNSNENVYVVFNNKSYPWDELIALQKEK